LEQFNNISTTKVLTKKNINNKNVRNSPTNWLQITILELINKTKNKKLWEKSLGGKNWNYFFFKRVSNFHLCQWNNKNTLHNTLNIQLPYINGIKYVRHGKKKSIIINFCKKNNVNLSNFVTWKHYNKKWKWKRQHYKFYLNC
jgi:hypothetical protein